MKKIMILGVFLIFSIVLIFPAKAKIFFLNLYDQNADVRLGEEKDFVFLMEGLKPYQASRLLNTTNTGSYTLYFKESSSKEWFYWSDENEPYSSNL